MNLLIINKDINATNFLRFHLEKNNYIVTHTENYESIVDIDQKYLFDVIVADFDYVDAASKHAKKMQMTILLSLLAMNIECLRSRKC